METTATETTATETTATETTATETTATETTADTTPGADTTPSPSASLEGPTWTLTPATALPVDLGDVVVTARFVDGMLAGESGCNSYRTPYLVDGSSLTIGPDIAGTAMACPEAETAIENAYLRALPMVASYEVEDSTLALIDGDGATLLEYEATVGAQAILGEWSVTSYYTGNAVTSVIGDVDLTATFGDQDVSGNTGCNNFNGPYRVDGDTIEIGPLASTLAACTDEELQQQEADYLAALELATTFTVTGSRLDLFRNGGTIAATLQRP
jgi:heat shock protein HslJ